MMGMMPPYFDPELGAVANGTPTTMTLDTLPQLRERGGLRPRPTDEELSRDGRFVVEERAVPGPPGAPDVSLLICRPVDGPGPRPVFYHSHGGGLIACDNREGIEFVLDYAQGFGAVVVSVEYRLAPEHPHPAPLEDVYAGYAWTAEHAEDLGGDPERIVIIGGSAGGGLTAALALLARDRKAQRPAGQVLHCPMIDDRVDTASAEQMARAGVRDQAAAELGWTALLGEERGGPDVSAYAAPARAGNLSGLPPAYIDVGSAESFRDEAIGYAARIWQAGGSAELHVWRGGFHGFEIIAPQAALSQAAKAARLPWLRRLLGE